jgi:hypothetical protein
MADVVFGYVWYNIQNVIIYSDRLTWITFGGLIITTMKTMFDDMTLPFRLSREVILENAAVIRIPEVSTIRGTKPTNSLSAETLETEINVFDKPGSEQVQSLLSDMKGLLHKITKNNKPAAKTEKLTADKEDDINIAIELDFKQIQEFCERIETYDSDDNNEENNGEDYNVHMKEKNIDDSIQGASAPNSLKFRIRFIITMFKLYGTVLVKGYLFRYHHCWTVSIN